MRAWFASHNEWSNYCYGPGRSLSWCLVTLSSDVIRSHTVFISSMVILEVFVHPKICILYDSEVTDSCNSWNLGNVRCPIFYISSPFFYLCDCIYTYIYIYIRRYYVMHTSLHSYSDLSSDWPPGGLGTSIGAMRTGSLGDGIRQVERLIQEILSTSLYAVELWYNWGGRNLRILRTWVSVMWSNPRLAAHFKGLNAMPDMFHLETQKAWVDKKPRESVSFRTVCFLLVKERLLQRVVFFF